MSSGDGRLALGADERQPTIVRNVIMVAIIMLCSVDFISPMWSGAADEIKGIINLLSLLAQA